MSTCLRLLISLLLLCIQCILPYAQLFASTKGNYMPPKEQTVTQSRNLSDVLKELEAKFNISIMYDSKFEKKLTQKEAFFLTNNDTYTSLGKAVAALLEPNGISLKKTGEDFYIIQESDQTKNDMILASADAMYNLSKNYTLSSNVDQSASKVLASITGMVKDASNGQPLPGVSVHEKGTSNGTVTNATGHYTLQVNENSTLVFSFIGYNTQEIQVGNRQTINVNLGINFQKLGEVVVIGYGTQQKKDITGSVASLASKNIKDIAVTNFENAIQGQVAGVQVQEPSGEPGAATTIRVRGVGSISAGNEPLYVIDGFPVSKNVDPGVQGDVARRTAAFRPPPANPLGTISPNDIESIEVLKDASAAAIYGSRGSNGVILITTKKGKREGKPIVGFDAYYGIQTVAKRVELMNAEQLAAYVKDAKNNAYLQDVKGADANDPNSVRYTKTNNGSYFLPSDFVNLTGTNTDWQDVIFNPAGVQNYNMSLSGGTSNLSYYVSGNYYSQDGIINNTGFDRYSFRVNLEANPAPKVKVGVNLNPSFTNTAKGSTNAPYFANPPGAVYAALVTSPTVSPYLPDRSINQSNNQSHLFTENGRNTNMTASSNPLAIIKYIHDDLSQFRNFGNVYGEYEILEGLKYKLYAGTDINTYNRKYYRERAFLDRALTTGLPFGQSNFSLETNWLVENTLSYEKTLNLNHYISAVAGYTAQKDKLIMTQVQAENYPDDLVHTVSGGQVTGGTSAEEEWALVSYLARTNYSFKDKYLFSATIRADRASRFGEGNRTGVFPSFSAGWRLSEENFLKGMSFLSDLKLRGSWGKTGNFLIPNYAAIGLLNPYNYVFGNAVVNGIGPSTPTNQKLTWEKNTQLDFGVDLGLIKDRIYFSVDWYRRITSDLLLNVQVPATVGFGSANPLQNIGEVENKGLELSLSSRNLTGSLTWNTDFNFSTNKNTVLKLGATGDPILSSGGAGIRHITQIGSPIGSYYGYVVDGIYQTQADIDNAPKDKLARAPRPGDFKFKDVNGDGVIDDNDRTVIGNYQPDYIWGITNRFGFKGFELSFLIQGVEGAQVLNLTRRHLGNGEANVNSYALWTERWISPDQPGNGKIPRADRLGDTHGFNNRPSDFQVEDASYIRLRNMTIGYNLPKQWLGNRIGSLRVYASGTNLWTQTDYLGFNPEVNNQSTATGVQGEDYGSYPLSRNITFGINASF